MEKQNISWEEIKHWSDILADKIAADCTNLEQATLIAISRGGLIPAQLIAYKLDIRDIRIMKLMSYNKQNEREDIKDISTDRLFDGGDVYFIDDLADSGATVDYVKKRFPSARIGTLLMKNCCTKEPDICARTGLDSDTWLVFPWD